MTTAKIMVVSWVMITRMILMMVRQDLIAWNNNPKLIWGHQLILFIKNFDEYKALSVCEMDVNEWLSRNVRIDVITGVVKYTNIYNR